MMLAGDVALIVAAVFSGAAIYINFAEQPARLQLDDHGLLAQWKTSYRRGFLMQAPLAIIGGLLGFAAWWTTGRLAFAVGGLFMIANMPWTVLGVMPTNKVLMQTDLASADPKTRALIVKWNALHGVRSALGVLATLSFLIAVSN
jgi:Domain of unknown function (DUF1772)